MALRSCFLSVLEENETYYVNTIEIRPSSLLSRVIKERKANYYQEEESVRTDQNKALFLFTSLCKRQVVIFVGKFLFCTLDDRWYVLFLLKQQKGRRISSYCGR